MTGKRATSAQPDRSNRRLGPRQMDLFEANSSEGMAGAPAWWDLPRETQDALTALMMQLILEHARTQTLSPAAMEACHDQ
jgi:hypothetical protein